MLHTLMSGVRMVDVCMRFITEDFVIGPAEASCQAASKGCQSFTRKTSRAGAAVRQLVEVVRNDMTATPTELAQ